MKKWAVGSRGLIANWEIGRCDVVVLASDYDTLLEAAQLFTKAAHEVRDVLNSAGLACPSSIAFAAERARNAIATANN